MTTEQPVPIEQLLKETETALYLGGWDYKIPNSTVRRLIDELRQRLEKEKQSDVEAALTELREMFPKYETVITRKAGWKWSRTTINLYNEKLPHGSASFEELTLSEAMAAVREWKDKQVTNL